jgi:hypothetical protein
MRVQHQPEVPPNPRELIHQLANSLGSARLWLVVLGNVSAQDRDAVIADSLAMLHRSIGDAEAACQSLMQLIPRLP